MGLMFLPRPPRRPLKRGRSAADVDGEHSCMQKKKRRLRLSLITSRLSPQFSYPATNIIFRGGSKIAIWAKQRSFGRNLLRKAAIFNRFRQQAPCTRQVAEGHGRVLIEQEREQEELQLAKLEFEHGAVDTYTRPVLLKTPSAPPAAGIRTARGIVVSGSPSVSPQSSRTPSPNTSPPPKSQPDDDFSEFRSPNEAYAYSPPRALLPRRDYLPLPPSPLGLSNYDAFDLDEEIPNQYSHLDEREEEGEVFPSLFHMDDDDDVVPFNPSAVTSPSSPTLRSTASHIPLPTAHSIYENYGVLEPDEPVVGDYDQVDEGADPVWPSEYRQEAENRTAGSTSPDFNAIFATASPKRIDSFAAPRDLRPDFPWEQSMNTTTSTSPNLLPAAVSPNFTAAVSPNFPPTTSPNFTSSTMMPLPISPNFAPASTSPNFSAIDAPTQYMNALSQRRHSLPAQARLDSLRPMESELDQERRRQRDLMFMRFGS